MRITMSYKVFILPVIILLSCNRYIDKSPGNTIPVQQGYLQIYSDSNVLEYKSNIALTMDTEKLYPKSFRVQLPKRIKYYEFVGSTDFAFYYDKSQVVLIKIDLENKKSTPDTSYVPSEVELSRFIQQSSTSNSNHKKYNISEMTGLSDRINKIIRRGDAEILLYNIVKEKEGLFSDYLSRLTIIDK